MYSIQKSGLLLFMNVQTLELDEWSKEVLDWHVRSGIQITLLGKASVRELMKERMGPA